MRGHAAARDVVQMLRDAGAADVRVEPGGRHAKARFVWRGRELFYPIPRAFKARGRQNYSAAIRRMLGLSKRGSE